MYVEKIKPTVNKRSYPRSTYSRRRVLDQQEDKRDSLYHSLINRTIMAFLIFLFLSALSFIHTPYTENMNNQVRSSLKKNYSINEIYNISVAKTKIYLPIIKKKTLQLVNSFQNSNLEDKDRNILE